MNETKIKPLATAILAGWDLADCDGEQAATAAQDDDAWTAAMMDWLTGLIR